MSTTSKKIISDALANKMLLCIKDYELIKEKKHPLFKTVKAFCQHNKICHQSFMRVLHRYRQNPDLYSLLPQKRGPKYSKRRTDVITESLIIEYRLQGNNRSAIKDILRNNNLTKVPCESTIYNICKKHKLNKLPRELSLYQTGEIRKMTAQLKGEMGHVDLHMIPKGYLIDNPHKSFYLFGIIDAYSRVCWLELIEDKRALTVMFATLRALRMLKLNWDIDFKCILTDNGAEFGSGKNCDNIMTHPFERVLHEMDIEHRYTRPYKPQTNGKIERFWKTLKEDFLDGSLFNNQDDLQEELLGYLAYYNEYRSHSAIGGKVPAEMAGYKRKEFPKK